MAEVVLLTLGIVLTVITPVVLLARARQAHLRTLGGPAAEWLKRVTVERFDAPPLATSFGPIGAIEGRRDGEPIELKANYDIDERAPPRVPRAEINVTIGLRGARPKLSLLHAHHVATKFEKRWSGYVEPGLLDADLQQAMVDYAQMLPHVLRIEVTPSGLSITLHGSPHDATEAERMDLANDLHRTILLAERIRARIYEVLEDRAHDEAADPYRQAQRAR